MSRFLIYVIIIAVILMLFGANGAESTLLNGALSIVKWVFILGFIAIMIIIVLNKKKNNKKVCFDIVISSIMTITKHFLIDHSHIVFFNMQYLKYWAGFILLE